MKSKKLKSILACVLVLCMVFGIQSNLAFVFAQENDDTIVQENITDYTTDETDTAVATMDDTKDTNTTGKDKVNTEAESEPVKMNNSITPASEKIPQSDGAVVDSETTITSDTTWSKETILTENLKVNPDVTLTLGANVTISGNITIFGGGTIKRDTNYTGILLSVPAGSSLTLNNITVDGGAVWSGETDLIVQRGIENEGIVAQDPLIDCAGSLIAENSIFQNNANEKNEGGTGAISISVREGTQEKGKLSMMDCIIRDNFGGGYGAGIYAAKETSVDLVSVSVYGNYGNSGGGVFFHGTVLLSDIDIYNNYANYGAGLRGGTGANIEFKSGHIHNNTAEIKGGGVWTWGKQTLTLQKDSKITNNTALGSKIGYDGGGGIYAEGGSNIIMNGGEISNNTAESADGGGVRVASGSTFTMNDGIILRNTAKISGGGIHNYGFCNFFGGSIIENTANEYGGGYYSSALFHGTVFDGTVIENNKAGLGSNNICFATTKPNSSAISYYDIPKIGANAKAIDFTVLTRVQSTDNSSTDNLFSEDVVTYFSFTPYESVDLTKIAPLIRYDMKYQGADLVPYVTDDNTIRFIPVHFNGGRYTEDCEFSVNQLAIPFKEGYKFDGWYTKDGTGNDWGNVVTGTPVAGNIYYAKWSEKTSISISFRDELDLNKIYDGSTVSLSKNDYIVTESAGNVTFAYQVKDGDKWKDISSTPINAGTYRVKAIVAENDTHKRAETDWKEFIISKAMPTYEVPTNLTAIVGQTLAEITLPEGFVWQDDTTTSVGSAGINTFKVTYTPKDTTNYNTITDIEVTLTVNPKMEELNAIPTINASDKTLTVGDKFDPLKDVTASDKEDGDITEKVEVLSNDVDTSKAGTYTVIYKVTDSKGASSTKTITVTVKGKDTQKPTIDDNKKPSATDTDKKPASTDKQTTSNSPKTGDSTNMTTWLALMFVSLGLLAGVFTVRKSRRSR